MRTAYLLLVLLAGCTQTTQPSLFDWSGGLAEDAGLTNNQWLEQQAKAAQAFKGAKAELELK